jgi:hypothetical protein
MPFPNRRRIAFATLAAVATCATLAGTAGAHGPTRQKVTEQVVIDAAPAVVWARMGNEVGSVRALTLKGGGALTETLEGYDAARMRYSYRAKDGGALPVTNYTSTISVRDEGGKALVEWRGAFYRGHPNNDPPPDQNDDAAVRAVTGVYQAGLANLKKIVETK